MSGRAALQRKLSKLPPLYQAHGSTYQADACRPVTHAMESGQIRYQALSRGHYPGRPLPETALEGLCLIGFWDAKHNQQWGLDWHRNEGIELTFLETGSLVYACDEQEHHLTAGDLTIARPWQPHRVGGPHVAASRLHFLVLDVGVRRPHQAWTWPSWVVLTPGDRKEITRFVRHSEQVVWHATSDVQRCFERIGRAVETDGAGSNASLLAAYLNELLVRVLELFRRKEVRLDESLGSTQRTVELFWSELTHNLEQLGEPWTVTRMARRCGLSTPQFTRLSKRLYNMTPNKHLNHCRVKQAARLLVEQPERTVTDIGLSVGFSSSQYFATVFHREIGCSPLTFRASPEDVNLRASGRAR